MTLNAVHVSEVPKVSVNSSIETTHAIKVIHLFDTAHPLIIPLHLHGVIIYFDMYSLSIGGYENEEITKSRLTGKNLQRNYQLKNIQNMKIKCQIIKIRSFSLLQ